MEKRERCYHFIVVLFCSPYSVLTSDYVVLFWGENGSHILCWSRY